jgi:hypothetical protein
MLPLAGMRSNTTRFAVTLAMQTLVMVCSFAGTGVAPSLSSGCYRHSVHQSPLCLRMIRHMIRRRRNLQALPEYRYAILITGIYCLIMVRFSRSGATRFKPHCSTAVRARIAWWLWRQDFYNPRHWHTERLRVSIRSLRTYR